jgi:hypothetical protein
MQHFRRWKEANDYLGALDAKDGRAMTISYDESLYTVDEETGEVKKPSDLFDSRQWAHVLALADIRLDNLPQLALEDRTGESTPFEVLAWLIPLTVRHYIREKLNLKN